MEVLKVSNLTKTFSSGCWPFQTPRVYTVVNNISFELKKGEILGFLGPNGAGKTTTIQMLLGMLTPSRGSIVYFGSDFSTHRIAALKKIGYASGYDRLPARLTVFENLDIIGRIYNIPQPHRTERTEKLLKFFGIWNMRDRQTGSLSAGQMTRVMLSKALINDPEIALLDEPTASLDPDIAHEVRKFIIEKRNKQNISILITSHNMDEVTQLCDRILVLKKGELIANNTPAFLAQSISKVRIYLTISGNTTSLVSYLNASQWKYEADGAHLKIELDEHKIAHFLADLSDRKIMYSSISIDKPTLEDYFLTIAK